MKRFSIFILLCMSLQSLAQSKFSDDLRFMINYHQGINLPEYPFISTIVHDYTRSADICIYKETKGKNHWEQLYNYPSYGISLFYSSLGNDEILGRELALNYFFRIGLLRRKRFELFNRYSIGLNYVSKIFDLSDNYTNVAVGSHVNLHFNLRFGALYRLGEKLEVNSGISFDHFSNGNTGEPNLGINYVSAYAGISYALGQRSERQVQEIPEHKKKNTLTLWASIGGTRSRALINDYFAAASLSATADRSVSHIVKLGIGADIFYDSSVKANLEKLEKEYKPLYNIQTGIHFAQTITYNRISFTLQEGFYLGLKERVGPYAIYNRGIVAYKLGEHWRMRMTMKSHLYILDYPELGVGYQF